MAEHKKKDIRLDIEPDNRWKCKSGYGVPKGGTGDPNKPSYCEACGNSRVRYMFVLEHPEYGTVRCGRNCAEKLLSGPRKKSAMNKQSLDEALRREVFLEQIWRFNAEKKTWFLRYNNIGITIIRSKFGNGFGILMSDQPAVWRRNGKPIETLMEAKETAFDIILAAEQRAKRKSERKGNY